MVGPNLLSFIPGHLTFVGRTDNFFLSDTGCPLLIDQQ